MYEVFRYLCMEQDKKIISAVYKSKQQFILILINFDGLNFCSINILFQHFHCFNWVFWRA